MMLVFVLGITFVFSSCSGSDDGDEGRDNNTNNTTNSMTPNNMFEISVTSGAKVLDYERAVLIGYANNAIGKVGFCYSATNPNPTPENSDCVETSIINSDNSYELTIEGLEQSTRYYYRAYASRGETKVMAKEIKNFTTEPFTRAAVDLGLSVKWANCNVGATAPEEVGDYFAWGETKPKAMDRYISGYYKWCNIDEPYYLKYVRDGDHRDNKNTLDPEDDAAHVNWGGAWRMPTSTEIEELCNRCTWERIKQGKRDGFKVTSKVNGNSIFIPATGFLSPDYDDMANWIGGVAPNSIHQDRGNTYIWSSSVNDVDWDHDINFTDFQYDWAYYSSCDARSGYAYYLYAGNRGSKETEYRTAGLSVRAVCPK